MAGAAGWPEVVFEFLESVCCDQGAPACMVVVGAVAVVATKPLRVIPAWIGCEEDTLGDEGLPQMVEYLGKFLGRYVEKRGVRKHAIEAL